MMTLGDARKKSSSSNNISAFLLNNPTYSNYRAPRVAPSNTLPFSGEPKTRFPTTMLHDISNSSHVLLISYSPVLTSLSLERVSL